MPDLASSDRTSGQERAGFSVRRWKALAEAVIVGACVAGVVVWFLGVPLGSDILAVAGLVVRRRAVVPDPDLWLCLHAG